MPKTPMDYSKLDIYQIRIGNYVYTGSTCSFVKRKYQHKFKALNFNQAKLYKTINENGGWEKATIGVIEHYPCNSFAEARERERYWMEQQLEAYSLNTYLPFTTPEEKDQYLADYMLTYAKQYYLTHRDELLEHHKEYYFSKKEEIKVQQKKYYESNRDKILDKMKIYYGEKKDKLLTYQKTYRTGENLQKYKEYQADYRQKKKMKKEVNQLLFQATQQQLQEEDF
jgi:hypothetical protein